MGKKIGLKEVLANEEGFFFFLFEHDRGLCQVLEAGPWFFGGKLLLLKKWYPQMKMVKDQVQKIPQWVQFYNVPLEFWTAACLSYIATSVGQPLYMDQLTAKCKRLGINKVCVEIYVNSDLLDSFDLGFSSGEVAVIGIKYPWKPLECFEGKTSGHSTSACPKKQGKQTAGGVSGPKLGRDKAPVNVTAKVHPVSVGVASVSPWMPVAGGKIESSSGVDKSGPSTVSMLPGVEELADVGVVQRPIQSVEVTHGKDGTAWRNVKMRRSGPSPKPGATTKSGATKNFSEVQVNSFSPLGVELEGAMFSSETASVVMADPQSSIAIDLNTVSSPVRVELDIDSNSCQERHRLTIHTHTQT